MNKNIEKHNITTENGIVLANKNTRYRTFLYRENGLDYAAHRCIEIIYVVKGVVKVKLKETQKILTQGDIFLVGSNVAHSIEKVEENILLISQIDIDYLSANSSIKHDILFDNENISESDRKEIIYRLGLLYLESMNEKTSLNQQYEILDELIEVIEDKIKMYKNVIEVDKDKTLEDIVDEIVERVSVEDYLEISLESLANDYNVSPSYLSRMFKKITGSNITEYFRTKRVNNAVHYLINTDLNVTEISKKSGFIDIKAMNRDLNKELGMSATKFRENYVSIIENESRRMLENDSYLEAFIFYIINENKERKLYKGKEKLKYIINSEENTIKEDVNWVDVLDMESIVLDDIDNIVDLFKTDMKFNKVRISLIFTNNEIFYIGRNGEIKELYSSKLEKIIEIFSLYRIYPIFSFDVTESHNSNLFCNSENKIVDGNCKKIEEAINIIASRVRLDDIKNWSIEIYNKNIVNNLVDLQYQKALVERFDHLKELLNNKQLSQLKLGFHVGQLAIVEYKKNKEHLDRLKVLGGIVDFVTFEAYYKNSDYIDIDQAICLIRKYKDKIKKNVILNNIDKEVFVDLRYISENRGNTCEDSQNPYYYLMYIYMVSKLIEKDFKVLASKIEYRNLETKDITDYFNIYNKYGLFNINYHVRKFFGRLLKDIIYMDSGILVTREGEDYSILVYGDIKDYINIVKHKRLNYDSISGKEINLNLTNLNGNYKKTVQKIGYRTYYFYKEWLENVGTDTLSSEEKEYIKSRSIPDLSVEYLDISEQLSITLDLDLVDIYLIRLEKN